MVFCMRSFRIHGTDEGSKYFQVQYKYLWKSSTFLRKLCQMCVGAKRGLRAARTESLPPRI